MANLDIIKENIEIEKSLGESAIDTTLREEYLIPDTHPDVHKVLSVEVNFVITNKEVQVERVLVEAQVEYNLIYLAREEEGLGVNNVVYNEKLSNFIDISGAEHKMVCDAECELEHINTNIINERKISIEAYFRTKCKVYKNESFEFVKDVDGSGDIQIKKKPDKIEKNITNKSLNMNSKTQMKVSMDKPQIGKIIKCSYTPHKKEVKISEDKIQTSCFVKIDIVYRAYDSRELIVLEDDIFLSNEEEVMGINNDMIANGDFRVVSYDYRIVQDDLGESRIIDIEVLVDADIRVYKIDTIEVIDDTYSPTRVITLNKDRTNMDMTIGEGVSETIVKDNIYLENEQLEPVQVISSTGKIVSLESKISNGKVVIEGILKVDTIYKCSDEEKLLGTIEGEVPFGTTLDIAGASDEMMSVIKGSIESLQSNIEANTIAVKAVISVYARVSNMVEKEYIKDIEEKDEMPEKKASIIIYVVQKGDSLWGLAKKYNTTIDEIIKLNNIDNPDLILEDQKLIIPGKALI